MRRPLTLVAAVLLAGALTGCGARAATSTNPTAPPVVVLDEDRCVPPPDGDGPWVEADDGEPCVQDWRGTWVEDEDDHHAAAHRTHTARPTARRATAKRTSTAKASTRARRTP